MLTPSELPLWQFVTARFRPGTHTDHGPRHWRTVLRNGLYLCRHHAADEEVVRFFALFHDSCRENEFHDPEHGCRGAKLALEFREAGHFHLDGMRTTGHRMTDRMQGFPRQHLFCQRCAGSDPQ